MKRRAAVLPIVILAAVLLPPTPVQAIEPSSIAVAHTPPVTLVAGDGAALTVTVTRQCGTLDTCGDTYVGVRYVAPDGSLRTVTAKGSKAEQETLTVVVPGADVRFPHLRYWIGAWFEATGTGGVAERSSINPVRRIVDWEPSLESDPKIVAVDHVLRSRFVRPDGSPVADMLVFAIPMTETRNRAVWSGTTDEAGWLRIPISRDDPWIGSSLQTGDTGAAIWLTGFDNAPRHPSELESGPVVRSGYAVEEAFDLNLGDPDLPAASELQDATIELFADTAVFTAASSSQCTSDQFGFSHVCWSEHNSTGHHDGQWIQIAHNVGSGAETEYAEFGFDFVKKWKSTIGVKVGSNTEWRAEGAVTTTDDRAVEANFHSGHVPSKANYGVSMKLDFLHEVRTICSFGFWCRENRETVRPETFKWLDPVNASASVYEHDLGRELPSENVCDSEDVFVPAAPSTAIKSSKSRQVSYSLDMGGDIAFMRYSLGFAGDETLNQGNFYHWKVPLQPPLSTKRHYLYIPDGKTAAGEKTPVDYPQLTYTHLSNRLDLHLIPRPVMVCVR